MKQQENDPLPSATFLRQQAMREHRSFWKSVAWVSPLGLVGTVVLSSLMLHVNEDQMMNLWFLGLPLFLVLSTVILVKIAERYKAASIGRSYLFRSTLILGLLCVPVQTVISIFSSFIAVPVLPSTKETIHHPAFAIGSVWLILVPLAGAIIVYSAPRREEDGMSQSDLPPRERRK